jgi:hypothetical protein
MKIEKVRKIGLESLKNITVYNIFTLNLNSFKILNRIEIKKILSK